MRGIPLWLMLIVWAVFLPAVYAGLPYLFSLSSRGYGWRFGHPTLANDLGLVIVIAGLAIVTWVMREHFRNFPKQGGAHWKSF
jgi:ABC-type glycerol-3-phosphate transport system permease component